MENLRRFYVYVLFRADGRPCYVGKGSGKRTKDHFRMGKRHYNLRLANIFAKHEREGLSVREEIRAKNLTEAEAFDLERSLIAQHGRADLGMGCLANLTDGGEGSLIGEDARRKISRANKGKPCPQRGRKGRIISAETRAKMSAAQKGHIWSTEQREKQSRRFLGKPRPECGRSGSESKHFGEKRSAESRALMSLKAKERWAKKRLEAQNG